MAARMMEDGCFSDGTGSEEDQLELAAWYADREYEEERRAMFHVPAAPAPIAPDHKAGAPVLVLHLTAAAMADPYTDGAFRIAGQHRRTA